MNQILVLEPWGGGVGWDINVFEGKRNRLRTCNKYSRAWVNDHRCCLSLKTPALNYRCIELTGDLLNRLRAQVSATFQRSPGDSDIVSSEDG